VIANRWIIHLTFNPCSNTSVVLGIKVYILTYLYDPACKVSSLIFMGSLNQLDRIARDLRLKSPLLL
jgi:hypothetical protein